MTAQVSCTVAGCQCGTRDLFTIAEARQLRDDGLQLVESSEPQRWQREAEKAIANLAALNVQFSSDDVCEIVGRPERPCAVGAVLMRAVRSGKLVRVGEVQSQRPAARARWLSTYKGSR
jgi:hypothetical protein